MKTNYLGHFLLTTILVTGATVASASSKNNANLPQILAGCGVKYFSTQKIYWNYNGGTLFPFDTFRWEGIDGTAIESLEPKPTVVWPSTNSVLMPSIVIKPSEPATNDAGEMVTDGGSAGS